MKHLIDEIAAVLPAMLAEYPRGPTVADMAVKISARVCDVRKAANDLSARQDTGVIVVRYQGARLHFRQAGIGFGDHDRVCAMCRVVFVVRDRPSRQRFCSRSCGCKSAWQDPSSKMLNGVQGRTTRPETRAKIRAAKSDPKMRDCVVDAPRKQSRMKLQNSALSHFGFFLWFGDGCGGNLADGTPKRLLVVIGTKFLGCFDEASALCFAFVVRGFCVCHRASGRSGSVGDLLAHCEVRHG